ncbi:MAG: hypothetical protein DDT26_00783 [Dehalococcoidia bacterium]|nr:hypothetical protein [Chloroflexota bacterium]
MGVEDRAEELKTVSQTQTTSSYGITSNDSNQRNSVTAATSENLVSNRQATNVASEKLRVDEKLDVVVAPKTSTQAAAESRARLETNDALIKRPAQQTSVNAVNAPSVSQASVTNHTYSGNQPKAFGIATA